MEEVKEFKNSGVSVVRKLRGNVQLEKMEKKVVEWIGRVTG